MGLILSLNGINPTLVIYLHSTQPILFTSMASCLMLHLGCAPVLSFFVEYLLHLTSYYSNSKNVDSRSKYVYLSFSVILSSNNNNNMLQILSHLHHCQINGIIIINPIIDFAIITTVVTLNPIISITIVFLVIVVLSQMSSLVLLSSILILLLFCFNHQ